MKKLIGILLHVFNVVYVLWSLIIIAADIKPTASAKDTCIFICIKIIVIIAVLPVAHLICAAAEKLINGGNKI